MNQERFDDLAKGLASGTVSRGQALRLMGRALLGGVLVSISGVAWANHKAGYGEPPGHLGAPPGQSGTAPGQGGTTPGQGCSAGTTPCGGNCVPVCSVPLTLNLTTCQCECPPNTCDSPKVQNPTTCACECPTYIGCQGGTVNTDTCLCECPTGTVLRNGQCRAHVCTFENEQVCAAVFEGSTCCHYADEGPGAVVCCPQGTTCGTTAQSTAGRCTCPNPTDEYCGAVFSNDGGATPVCCATGCNPSTGGCL